MNTETSKKTLAKNTLFLYFRMMFTMIVSLFTSRVILQALGIEDFGIYQTVGGVVGLLTFINGALATGSSRFLTYELGTGDFTKLKKTFSTVLTIHIILAIIIVIAAETAGLWFVNNRLVIPEGRMDAAVWAYHMSVLSIFFTVTQIPYNASIISHEKMSVYAYMSIIEVSLKLAIVYLLYISPYDKLKTYTILYLIVNAGILIFYRWYCMHKFEEAHYNYQLDKGVLKDVLGYSFWNLFANTSIALSNQGATLLVNSFFNPSVVTSRAIANQVNMAANQFVNNFRTAVNPQIVKRYASGDIEHSKTLLLKSTTFSFFLMYLLSLPICILAEPILFFWLGQVPEYSVAFLQITIITSLFQVFDTSFYTALYAKGRIKENAKISPTIVFMVLPISYILYRFGCSPIALAWVLLAVYVILGLIVKPLLLIKICNYKWSDFIMVFMPCISVSVFSSIIPVIVYSFRETLFPSAIIQFISLTIICLFSVAMTVWFLGLDKEVRTILFNVIKKKIKLSTDKKMCM